MKFVLSVGKIKSTDFTDFTDVAKQESVIFVLSVGKKQIRVISVIR